MAKNHESTEEISKMLSEMFSYEVKVKEVKELPFTNEQAHRYIFAANEKVKVYQYISQNFAVIGTNLYEF